MKKVWNAITTVLVALVVLVAVALVGMRIFGMRPYTVLSGSMEPNYPVGSMVFVKEVDPSELKEGDVITYMVNSTTVVTHRIVGLVPDENDPTLIRFRTKGDNNDSEDGLLVHPENVIGRVLGEKGIPKVGYAANFFQSKQGTFALIGLALVLLLLVFLPDIVAAFMGKDDEKEEGAPDEKPDNQGSNGN